MNKRDRRKAILAVFETWDDHECKRALEWVENGRPILVGCGRVRWAVLTDEGAL